MKNVLVIAVVCLGLVAVLAVGAMLFTGGSGSQEIVAGIPTAAAATVPAQIPVASVPVFESNPKFLELGFFEKRTLREWCSSGTGDGEIQELLGADEPSFLIDMIQEFANPSGSKILNYIDLEEISSIHRISSGKPITQDERDTLLSKLAPGSADALWLSSAVQTVQCSPPAEVSITVPAPAPIPVPEISDSKLADQIQKQLDALPPSTDPDPDFTPLPAVPTPPAS